MHVRRVVLISIAGLFLALVLSGCGRNTFATVNGEKITKDEFYKRVERSSAYDLLQVTQQQQVDPHLVQAGPVVLEQMINEKIIEQVAKQRNVLPTDAQIQKKIDLAKKDAGRKGAGGLTAVLNQRRMSPEDYKKELYATQCLLNIVTKGVKVSDTEVRDFYNRAKDRIYTTPENVRTAVIICEKQDKINVAYDKIKSGTDFSTVALNMSEDARTRGSGGELQPLVRGMRRVVPPIVIDTAFGLKIGEISKPFVAQEAQSPARWVIIKALDHRQKSTQSFDEVKDQIREGLAFGKGQKQINIRKILGDARESAKIKVKSDRYKGLEKTQAQADKSKKTGK